ncbi:MAG: monooxygenase [Actinobacteria bacterium 13_2_20CM_2_72_6]|nr:MAG: monooxygenase [Actinobacteria bacterium 13_2_20CM_2_72_6]
MADYRREIRFGYFLVPYARDPLLETAREVELRGLDYVAVQDHPYQRRYVDTWTLLSMIGGSTEAIEAYGGPRREPGAALAALAEAIEVIRLVWSGTRNLRFDGAHYRLAGAQSGPVPAHPIGIWLGVYGPRALRLAGRVADGWIPSLRGELPPLRDMAARLDDAAAEAGRDPGAIRRVLNVSGAITDGAAEGLFNGPVEHWVEQLTELAVRDGFDTFILAADAPGQLARFAEEVVPAVRSSVVDARW